MLRPEIWPFSREFWPPEISFFSLKFGINYRFVHRMLCCNPLFRYRIFGRSSESAASFGQGQVVPFCTLFCQGIRRQPRPVQRLLFGLLYFLRLHPDWQIGRRLNLTVQLFRGCLCIDQLFRVPCLDHEKPRMEARFQVLQQMGFVARNRSLRGRHVFDGLGHGLDHFRHRFCPLLLHQLPQTRGQLGKLNASSTICDSIAKCPDFEWHARACEELQAQNLGLHWHSGS